MSRKLIQISPGSKKPFSLPLPPNMLYFLGWISGGIRMKHPTDLVGMGDVCHLPVLWEFIKPLLYQLKIIMNILFLVHTVFVCVYFFLSLLLPTRLRASTVGNSMLVWYILVCFCILSSNKIFHILKWTVTIIFFSDGQGYRISLNKQPLKTMLIKVVQIY